MTSDDEEALKTALASMLDGISASNIFNLVVESYMSSRRALLTDTSVVTFDIIVTLSESDFDTGRTFATSWPIPPSTQRPF